MADQNSMPIGTSARPLTLQDLQSAVGPVGEQDDVGGSRKTDGAAHPYGDDDYGKKSSAPLKQLGAGKSIKPGSGM